MRHQALKKSVLFMLCCMMGVVAMAQQRVDGSIKDADGNPLIGVSVYVDGKAVAISDIDGLFSLPSVTSSSKVEFTFLGYKKQTVTIGNKKQLNIVLAEDQSALEEVVVVGYGTMKKNDLTGAVGSVGNQKLNEKGAPSILEALQGTTPGVNITKSSGRTDGSMNIEIRGKNSISGSQNPIYVVDGVVCSSIDFLNNQDIERIDVLKDASSTAIYGSRATAGVVMVTTKSGSGAAHSKPTISYDGYYGVTKVARMPDLMTGQDYYNFRFMKFLVYAGGTQMGGKPIWDNNDIERCLLAVDDRTQGDYRMKQLLAEGKTYNWRDLVLQDGHQQNHYVAISGSGDKVNYHIGLGYNNERGIYKNDNQDKFTIKGNLDAKLNDYISAGLSVNLARMNHDYASDTGVTNAFHAHPFMQPFDDEGNINKYPGDRFVLGTNLYQFTSSVSPLYYMREQSSNRLGWTAMTNVYLQITPLKGLSFKTTFSPTFSYERYGFFQGKEINEQQNSARRQTSQGFGWIWDNMLTYDHTWGIHHLNLMGLVSTSSSTSESENLYYNNVAEGTYWWALGTSNQGYNYNNSSTGYGESSLQSYALRANYTLKDRYMLTATVRWDGSSKFRPDHRWASFPSMAVAWRASEEEFIKNVAGKWLSNLKLRLSYGVTGNNSVGNYATQLTVAGPVYYPFGSTYNNGMYIGGVVDRNLEWEKSHEVNFGLDFGIFNERIRGSVDIYNKKSTDLLYNVQLPLVSGGGSMQTNIGSVCNKGIEVSLTTENIVSKDWRWTTTFTFAHNKNEVLEVNGDGNYYNGNSSTGNLIIGQPYNNVYGYEWNGIVSDRDMTVPDTEVARLKGFTPGETVKEYTYYNACYGLVEGNPIIVDRNGDGKFTDEDKKIYKSDPDWTGSLTSNLYYKNWDFSFSIYAKQNYTIFSNFYRDYLNMDINSRGTNKLQVDWYIPAGTLLDCDGRNPDGTYLNPKYQETTHYGSYPFPNAGDGTGVGSEYWNGMTNSYTDASFVKIKHITLGYTLPKQWLSKISCQSLRLYCTVTNPFVFTDYKGYDPEWANAATQNDGPSTVTWQIGASVKF